MSKNFVRILCLVMSIIMVVGLLAGLLATVASAATVYQLASLLADGKIKPLGRTQTSLAGDSITADWSGSGFDINVSGDGGTLTVGFKASYTAYWAILVDGDQIWRAQTASGTGTFSAEIPAGKHTVRVVKETQMSSSESAYSYLTTLTFDGTIEKAPANRGLYIEFVGDSITCGDGALGEYEPGVKWLGAHDSATHSYAYYAAQKLGADYSLVARGGIGLFVGISEAEGTAQKKGMQDIYNYTSAYNPTSNGEYSFSRQPDVVFIELGANDGIDSSDQYKTIAYWKSLMEDFIDQVRSKNPNAQIVLHSTNSTKYKALLEIQEARKETDPKIHTFYYAYLGNGSAALATQYAGHPDYNDLERFGDALAKFLKAQDIVPTSQSTPSYTDITYYISENGNDANDGKTIDTAKKTLNATINQARTDNGTFAAGSRVVVYVQGTVKGSSNNNQGLLTGGVLKDSNGARVPVLITTYDYNGTKAILDTGHAAVNDGNGSIVFYNDVTLKDITFQSTTNEAKGYRDRNLYAGYNKVVFDNVTFAMVGATPTNNTGWRVSGGTAFGTDALPAEGEGLSSITFKNGDYTNLNIATAVISSGMWKSSTETIYDVPNGDFRLYIEDGAKMGTVYNRYGNLNVGHSEVVINGGSVNQYVGTVDATSSARKIYKGDINLTVNGGEIYGTHFSTAGRYATIQGDINTTINGGIFRITPQDTASQYDAYFFGGRQNCVVENINTTITGGQLYLICDVAGVDTNYYFGVSGGGTVKNVTNKISGGLFMPYARKATGVECCVYLGNHTGTITGTLRNEITGGNFQFGLSGLSDRTVNAGSRGVNLAIGKIENVFGKSGSTHGPNMSSAILKLAGGWAQVGVSAKQTAQPTACSDTVVVSNTIYGGNYGKIYFGTTGNPNTTNGYYSFINGSIENKIYGGFFQNYIYCAGNGPVFGHVKTDVYGGYFKSIYGGTENKATVFDGVELNIYGMDEYYPVNPNDTWVFCGGNASGKVPVPMTAGRDAIKLNIAPSSANDLTLNTRVKVGDTDGTTSVSVKRGTFPRGFAVEGTTVGGALASGSTVFDASTGTKATFATSDSSVSGSVVVDSDGESYTNHLEYYVSEFGLDAYSGTSAATPKKTLSSLFSKIVSDNGGSTKFPTGTKITVYVEGAVDKSTNTSTQIIGHTSILRMATINDHVPITITTLDYDGTNKATILVNHKAVNGGNATAYVVNDLYFKDIELRSVTNAETGYCDNNFYAAGCNVTFDNCSLTTDGKATKNVNAWNVNADHFSTGGFNPLNTSYHPHNGSVTFKNGDYTNLNRVAAVGANNIWRSEANGGSVYSIPQMHTKVIIEDGAKMGTVYNTFGTLAIGSATVEVRGGTVEEFIGTQSGYIDGTTDKVFAYSTAEVNNIVSGGTVKSFMGTGAGYYNSTSEAGQYITITGNVTNTFSGGTVEGVQMSGMNNYVKLTGNLTNNFTGGKVETVPTNTADNCEDGIFLTGRNYAYVTGTVTNNITAGSLGVRYTKDSIQSGIWFGLRSGGKITGDLVNNVSGGEIYTRAADGITAEYAAIHFGNFSGGSITGTLRNTFTAGTFEAVRGSFYFGQQGTSGYMGGVVNVLGDKATGNGPTFNCTGAVILAGGWGKVGAASNVSSLPAESKTTDTVVVSNTIYGGTYNCTVNAGLNNVATKYVTFIQGSVENNIYGGTFRTFYGNGDAPTYGKVTTNIYGGTFDAIYGNRKAIVYDGVELNIYGMTEGENPTGIWAAGTTPTVSTLTADRDAVKFTIQPTDKLTLSMPISAGCNGTGTITGTTSVLVTGGTYTKGFAVDGVTVKAALAEGLVPLKDGDKTIVTVTDTMTTTGTDSVTLVSTKWTEDSATLTMSDPTVTWDGNTDAKVPDTIVKFHNSTLVKDTDYTVSYSRDGEATTDLNSLGTVTVTVTAKAPWSGSLTTTYTIVRDDAVGKAIADVTEAVNAYDEATVTADDSADLVALTADIDKILTDNAEVLTEQEKASLAALKTTVKDLEDVIASVKTALDTLVEAADAYRADIVTADDTTALEELEKAIAALPAGNLTDAQKAEQKAAADKVDAMQTRIQDTAAKLAEVKAEAAQIDTATVTADDSEVLADLAADLAALSDGNLTSAQKAEKQAAADKLAAAQKILSDTAKALSDAKAAADAYNEESVTPENKAALQALAADLAAIPDGNLTAAQKSEKKTAADKVAALLALIADASDALAEAAEEVAKYDAATVTADDKAALEALKTRLAAIPDSKLTPEEQVQKKQLSDSVDAMLKTIAQVGEKLEDAKAALAALDAATVTADDSADLADLASDIAAIPEGNLTAAQKAEKKAAADKVTALQKVVSDTAAALAAVKEAAAAVDATNATSEDTDELAKLASDIAAIPEGNLTAAQKTEKKAAADKVAAAQKTVADATGALAEVETALEDYSTSTVTADDEAALVALAAKLDGVSNNNLTNAERADKQVAAEKIEALRQKIADTAADLAAVKEAAAAVDTATVTADDSEKLEKLASDIAAISDGNLTDAQKAEKQAAADKVTAAQKVVSDTAAALKALEEREAAFDAANLTSDDKAKLQTLIADTQAQPTGNMTEAQKSRLAAIATSAANKIAIIEKAEQLAGDIGAIEAALAGKTTENVTSADSAALAAAKNAIDELQKDESLSAADKAKLSALETKADELTAQLEKAEEAAEVPEAVKTLTPATVEKENKAALEEAIADLEKAEAEYGNNYTAAEKQAIADAKAELEETLAVIEAVEAVEEQAAALPKTAEPDDEKAIADLQAAKAAYEALDERQKAMVDEGALKQMNELDAALRNYKITKGDKAEWTLESGKDLSFTVNGLFAKFQGILVDGKAVDSKYYTAVSGSTIVTISDDYLNTLAKGEHKLTVVFDDGSVEGTFTVKAKAASPSTGDETNLMLLSMLAIFSLATAAAITIQLKKRTH